MTNMASSGLTSLTTLSSTLFRVFSYIFLRIVRIPMFWVKQQRDRFYAWYLVDPRKDFQNITSLAVCALSLVALPGLVLHWE